MDKKFVLGYLVCGGIILFVIFVLLLGGSTQARKDTEKLNNCIFLMQKYVPDPNDDQRASFLQQCYENR